MLSKTLSQSQERVSRVPEIFAAIAIGIALLALAGWLSGARFLAGQWDSYIPMAPSSALALLVLAGALFCFARWHTQHASRLFALTATIIVCLLGLLVLAQFITGLDLGIEQVLSRTNELLGSTPLGRMSPLTAVAFLLESAAFFILLIAERWRNASTAATLLAAGGATINGVVLIGYVYGAPLLYGGTIIPVALPTAVAFVLVGVGLFYLAVPGVPALRNWSGASMRGILLRAFLPFMLFFVLVQGWLNLTIQPDLSLNPAVWQSLMALIASVLIVLVIGWIAQRTGIEIERVQKTLAESEERFRTLVEQASDGIFISDAENRFIEVNLAGCRMLGYTREEILQKTVRDLTKASPAQPLQLDELRQGKTLLSEREMIRKDGTLVPVEVSAKQLADGRVQGFVRDITERLRADEQLQRTKARLANILENASEAVVVVNRKRSIIVFNQAAERVFGYRTQEILGQSLDLLIPEHLVEIHRQHVQTFAASPKETNPMENRSDLTARRKDGSVFPVEVGLSTLTDEDGEVLFTAMIVDITERKHAEEALRASEERFSKIFHASPVAISVTTLAEARFVEVNDSFLKLLGQPSREEIIGRSVLELGVGISPEYRTSLAQTLRAHGRVSNIEAQFDSLAGEKRDVLASLELIELNGQSCIVTLAHDITERKRAEEEIKTQLTELQRWHDATLGRETRVLDLKREVNELLGKAGQPPRYPSVDS